MAKKNQQSTPVDSVQSPQSPWTRLYVDIPTDVNEKFAEKCRKKGISKRAAVSKLVCDYVASDK